MMKPAPAADENSDQLPDEAILAQLERILSSSLFIASPSLSEFLQFVVSETLAGRADQIKEYTVAVRAWGRESDFDPQADPIVRVQAGRLRRAVRDYYAEEGGNDPVHIEIPKGTYIPRFTAMAAGEDEEGFPTTSAKIETIEPVVVVAPFQNVSGEASQGSFVDGFGEQLTVHLSRFQALTVIAYYSSRRFRDVTADVLQIGQQVGADFVVAGSVYRDDARLRISATLTAARTGIQLWGQRFDRELTAANLFDLQDAIIEQIVAAIGSSHGVIPREMAKASQGKRTDDLSVYEAVLRRMTFLMSLTAADHRGTKQALERAVTIDPAYAPAWAGLGGMYATAHLLGLEEQDDPLGQALDCVNRALRLDPRCQEAYAVLANIHFQRRDRDGVSRACHRVLELNPNDAIMAGLAGFWLALAGDDERGLAHLEHASTLIPFHPGWFHIPYCLRHFVRREYEQAYTRAQGIAMPGLFWDPLLRSATLSRLNGPDKAQAALRELLQLKPGFPERAHHYLGTLVITDDLREQLLHSLHDAGLPTITSS